MGISTDITTCAASLGALAGNVDENTWAYLRLLRNQLNACAEQARAMEDGLVVPGTGEGDAVHDAIGKAGRPSTGAPAPRCRRAAMGGNHDPRS